MLHQGKLKGWDAAKGSGFIQQMNAGPDIPISSSGFRKKPEQLQDGDLIFFQIEVDAQARTKAVLAYKAGQRFAPAPLLKKPRLSSLPFQQLLSVMLSVSILAWLGYQFWYLLSPASSSIASGWVETEVVSDKSTLSDTRVWPPVQDVQSEQESEWQCEGKIHCTEMRSCDEAKFYLNNCPDVAIDGDRDGIPCEQQWCSRQQD